MRRLHQISLWRSGICEVSAGHGYGQVRIGAADSRGTPGLSRAGVAE